MAQVPLTLDSAGNFVGTGRDLVLLRDDQGEGTKKRPPDQAAFPIINLSFI